MKIFQPVPLIAALAIGLAACAPQDDENGKRVSRAGEGRAETAGIRNTENIGYAGNAIAGKVDQALDVNDNRAAELEAQIDAQTQDP